MPRRGLTRETSDDLPIFDEPKSPLLSQYQHEHTRTWAVLIAELAGFVFVEHNRSLH